MITMHDVVSPAALMWAKIIGYGIFLIAVVVILSFGLKLYCEGQTAYNRYYDLHSRR